jgi:hypothetical protein
MPPQHPAVGRLCPVMYIAISPPMRPVQRCPKVGLNIHSARTAFQPMPPHLPALQGSIWCRLLRPRFGASHRGLTYVRELCFEIPALVCEQGFAGHRESGLHETAGFEPRPGNNSRSCKNADRNSGGAAVRVKTRRTAVMRPRPILRHFHAWPICVFYRRPATFVPIA